MQGKQEIIGFIVSITRISTQKEMWENLKQDNLVFNKHRQGITEWLERDFGEEKDEESSLWSREQQSIQEAFAMVVFELFLVRQWET